jgi:hypothetical protein
LARTVARARAVSLAVGARAVTAVALVVQEETAVPAVVLVEMVEEAVRWVVEEEKEEPAVR